MAGRKVIGLCLGVALQVLLAAAARDQMSMLCSDDDTPACAQSRESGMYFLFANECDLRKAQRGNLLNGPLYDVTLRFCFPSCEFECGPRYQPVCGISSQSGERKTFRSRCEMMRTACLSRSDWKVQQWGVCPKANTVPLDSQKAPVPVPCTRIYRPVCAMYAGVKSTFSNECLVNAENIKTQRNWRIVSEGLCGEDSTKMKHSRQQKPKTKPKSDAERTKRSHKGRRLPTQAEDFQIPEDAVQIYAPSTFHTQFISHTGAMEKSYSLPARKPYVVVPPKSKVRRIPVKSCVFGSEPVCGSFKGQTRTFTNVCELMEYSQQVGNAWTISHDGACRRCDKPCPTVYQPICATRNGINHTIINECYLERVRCKDPKTIWKVFQKGECPKTSGEAKGFPSEISRPLPLVPRVLYGKKTSAPQTRSTKTVRRSTTTKAPFTPSKPRLPVKKTFKATSPSLEVNNRKIRKIELATAGFPGYGASSGPNQVSTDEDASWSSNDNWLVRKTLDNVKGFFGKKPTSFKKTHSQKSPFYYWTVPPKETSTTSTVSTVSRATSPTTAAPPAKPPAILSMAPTELLNLDVENAASAYEDAEHELLLMLTTKESTTSSSTTPVPSTTAPPSTIDPSTTEGPTSANTATSSAETASEDSTFGSEETTDPPTTSFGSTTTIAPPTPSSTTEAEELNSQTTGSESTTTEASDEAATTTLSSDYTADESFSESSGQTSIYGLDKNSLIMRLLRARSNQNVLI
ncbi:mucin-2 [Drosophila biarmipes]|uniref:mucin-2 n=1 Tax=Drosophila biarmipes TaxID=125945 RepID=UPI0007E63725|nr:mucin-2 [Drosophila biarmipes]